ncbi:hypothetical protein J3A78_007585 [Streptomyces sp. PvR006]|uniref:hypothetical protein n=1 Tax=Streptomyces sp. PvR006 TaxID=2817860 RepID=UPI001FD876B5|nr:hypothetical protein [Streptomyces sp. PvR006]MBP2587107.1 hypothetical protein [Streptomyces sp. PvR006]
MSYRLDAVVGEFDLLRGWAQGVPGAVVAPLRQRMGLLPLSGGLRGGLPSVLRDLSRGGPVAHLVADFWGGDGEQTAAVWRGGEQQWGPVHTSEFRGPREEWPINAALTRLGLAPAGPGAPDHRDLFAEVGLGQGRDEEDWHRAALSASGAADYDAWYEAERAARASEERAAAERALSERLPGVPAALDGKEIIALLGMPPGRWVGAAICHLQQLHLDHGPQSREGAESALRAWAAAQGLPSRAERAADSASPQDRSSGGI